MEPSGSIELPSPDYETGILPLDDKGGGTPGRNWTSNLPRIRRLLGTVEAAGVWYSQSDSNGRHARYKLAALTGLSYGSMVKSVGLEPTLLAPQAKVLPLTLPLDWSLVFSC